MTKFAKPTDQEHRRPADRFMDRWHIDGKIMFGVPYLVIVDEALGTPWALLGVDRPDMMQEYHVHKQREEVHARRRLGAVDVVECKLREQRSDGAREFVSALVREIAEGDGTKLELRAAGDAEQSGRAEGMGRIIAEHTKAMIWSASLPGEMGPYAVEYFASYVYWRIPNQSRKRENGEAAGYNTP